MMRANCNLLAVALVMGLLATVGARAQAAEIDEDAVRKLHTGFFESLRQGGAVGVVANLRQTAALDARDISALEPRLRALEAEFGRPDAYALLHEAEVPRSPRFRSALFFTYHEAGPVGWRLRFYRRVTGVWVIAAVQFESQFVEDFIRLGEVEFSAHRALLDRLPTKAEWERMLKEKP